MARRRRPRWSATLLEAGGLDPTVINGGIINAYGTNARMGEGEWMVVEADESDGTFLKLPADVAVVTNIDPEHLDHYGNFDAVRAAFRQFVENVPFYGFGVMCLDHPEVQALVGRIEDRKVITYGENPQADVRFMQCPHRRRDVSIFDVEIRRRRTGQVIQLERPAPADAGPPQRLQCHGGDRRRQAARHLERGHRQGLAGFGGVKRRFTLTGDMERRADIRRLRPSSGRDQGGAEGRARQPARAASSPSTSRIAIRALASLFEEFAACFNDADSDLPRADLCGRRRPDRRRDVGGAGFAHQVRRPSRRALPARRRTRWRRLSPSIAQPGDFVVLLGAGNITQLGGGIAEGTGRPFGKVSMKQVNGEKLLASLGEGVKDVRGPADAGCADGPRHLVPRRRPGRTDVPAA